MTKHTSWGKVGDWYHDLLEGGEKTYQSEVILPNLLRLIGIKPGMKILDLACGEGFFSRHFQKAGAKVIGVDIGKELIEIAKKESRDEIQYHVSPAHDLPFVKDEEMEIATIILALQNIENAGEVIKEAGRVLKERGRLFLVLNHPAFRIPKESSWGYDEEKDVQYRRIDSYLSGKTAEINMEPGSSGGKKTVSFHHPLQFYFKTLQKSGFLVSRLEEWTSFKKSEPGPKQVAEDRARKEIPLFLMLEAKKAEL